MGGGGGKRGGVENVTNDTPPKKGFWTPLVRYVFHPPQVSVLCFKFPVQKSTTEQTRSSFGGVQTFWGERVLWYVFLPPYVLHPPISRPKFLKEGQKRRNFVPTTNKLHKKLIAWEEIICNTFGRSDGRGFRGF